MLIVLFYIEGIVHEEFVLAGQTVNCVYYCDVLRRLRENVQRLRSELWRQKILMLHRDNAQSHTFFYTTELFTQSNMTIVPNPLYFPVSSIEDKT
jgi:predicted amino acid dehydrogenase